MAGKDQVASRAIKGTVNLPFANPQDAMNNVLNVYTGWLSNASRFQSEAIRFLGDRFNKDVENMKRLSSCRKPEEFLNTQSEILSNLLADYVEESTKVVDMLTKTAEWGLKSPNLLGTNTTSQKTA